MGPYGDAANRSYRLIFTLHEQGGIGDRRVSLSNKTSTKVTFFILLAFIVMVVLADRLLQGAVAELIPGLWGCPGSDLQRAARS